MTNPRVKSFCDKITANPIVTDPILFAGLDSGGKISILSVDLSREQKRLLKKLLFEHLSDGSKEKDGE